MNKGGTMIDKNVIKIGIICLIGLDVIITAIIHIFDLQGSSQEMTGKILNNTPIFTFLKVGCVLVGLVLSIIIIIAFIKW